MRTETVKAERRATTGSASARRLRRDGRVPGVLYGHGEDVVLLTLAAEPIHQLLETGHHLVTLDLDGLQERALMKSVQFDPWGQEILHVDFTRVRLDETVTVSVEIVPHGTPKSVLSGGVLEQPLHTLELECKADTIPDNIRVEVGELDAGEMVHVGDLQLPEGVRAVAEPDAIVFVVQEARAEEAPAEPVPDKAAEEPEVISRVAKEESDEEKK